VRDLKRGIIHKIARILSRVEMLSARVHGLIVVGCGALLFLQMFLQVSDVTGRYLFAKPTPGTLEISESVLVFITFLGLAYVLARGEHVRVTILLDRLSPERRAWFDIFAFAIGFLIMLFIAWRALPYAIYSYKVQDTSGTGTAFDLPLYPAKFAFFVGSTMLCMQFLIQLLNQLFARLTNRIPSGSEKA